MQTLIIVPGVFVVALGLAGAALALRSRQRRCEQGTDPDPSSGPLAEVAPIRETLLIPLPNRRNEALILGAESELAALEKAGLISRSPGPSSGPLPQVVRTLIAAGGPEANRRLGQGV